MYDGAFVRHVCRLIFAIEHDNNDINHKHNIHNLQIKLTMTYFKNRLLNNKYVSAWHMNLHQGHGSSCTSQLHNSRGKLSVNCYT